jgi:hypothetical protein
MGVIETGEWYFPDAFRGEKLERRWWYGELKAMIFEGALVGWIPEVDAMLFSYSRNRKRFS